MLERKNAIVFLAPAVDAVAVWRLYMPHLSLPGSSFFCFSQHPDFSHIVGNDIVVVQRCCLQPQFDFIKMAKSLGMKVVYDLDDDVWDLPEYNPAHEMLRMARNGFNACIRMVDLVTVSTKTLAKVVRKNVKFMTNVATGKEIPIVVAENRLYSPMFSKPRKLDRVTVGWAGSSSHIGDLPLVERALITMASEHKDVDIEFRGCVLKPDNPLLKLENFRFKLWTPVSEFGARLPQWGWHVGLAPVTKHEFNASKSCIKMVEMAYCQTPCLASWVQPYDEFCSHDPSLRWLLCPAPSAWEWKLRDLINDPAMREELGQKMYNVMKTHYTFDRGHEGWQTAFDMVRGSN